MKFQWVKERDAISKLFHRFLNASKSKNFISKLEKEDGSSVENEEDIVTEILSFYSKLYNEGKSCHVGFDGVEWSPIAE